MSGPLFTGSAPGKVVLFGEHAVVYGRPAIAATIGAGLGAVAVSDPAGPCLHIPAWGRAGLTLRPAVSPGAGTPGFESLERGFAAALAAAGLESARLRITVDGPLPPGVGLGSSAAFAVSILRALAELRGEPFSLEALVAAAAAVEQVFHGTPSGVDHNVVARGGCLRFQRGAEPELRPIALAAPVPVVIAWTPRRGVTREAVAAVRRRRARLPALYESLFDTMAEIVQAGTAALQGGDWAQLGALMNLNHGLLSACGVSSLATERLVWVAREHGALGAKLTGAGRGGAVVAVVPPERHPKALCRALAAEGVEAFATELGC